MRPVTFDITAQGPRDRQSSGLRLFYALPHLVLVGVLSNFASLLALLQWLIVLFTGKRNASLWRLGRGVLDWEARATTYLGLMYDTYPNFGFERRDEPVTFDIEYEETANRLTCALRLIWAIPAMLITIVLTIAGVAVTIASWFAIVFTGTHPQGMFGFLLRVHRMAVRTSAYLSLLTDTYPKFD